MDSTLKWLISVAAIAAVGMCSFNLSRTAPSHLQKGLGQHEYYQELSAQEYARRSETMQPGPQIVFIGDSRTSQLCVESVFKAVNFSINGDTAYNAQRRVKTYKNLDGKLIVLALGINDIPQPTERIIASFRNILDTLSPKSIVMVSSVVPVNEKDFLAYWKAQKPTAKVQQLNRALQELCSHYKRVYFEDTAKYLLNADGQLRSDVHRGDGIHFNLKGNQYWIRGLQESMADVARKNTALP